MTDRHDGSPDRHDGSPDRHDLFTVRGATLAEAAALVATVTGLVPARRHSTYWGGDHYLWRGPGGAELRVCANVPDEDGEPLEPDAPQAAVLLYASTVPAATFDRLHAHPRFELLASWRR